MRELDVLLSRWLEDRYGQADTGRQAAFRNLLERSNPDLIDLLIGGRSSGEAPVDDVIEEIRAAAVHPVS